MKKIILSMVLLLLGPSAFAQIQVCGDTPKACSTFSERTCLGQKGCFYDSFAGRCLGKPRKCSDFSVSSCTDQKGCRLVVDSNPSPDPGFTPTPVKRELSVRLQSKSKPSNCIGGSSRGNKVGLWSCTTSVKRYNWSVWSTNRDKHFYLVDDEKGKCLSRKSKTNKVRYYEFKGKVCEPSNYRVWLFKKRDGSFMSANEINTANLDEVQIVNMLDKSCVQGEKGSTPRMRDCLNANYQKYIINPPGPIR